MQDFFRSLKPERKSLKIILINFIMLNNRDGNLLKFTLITGAVTTGLTIYFYKKMKESKLELLKFLDNPITTVSRLFQMKKDKSIPKDHYKIGNNIVAFKTFVEGRIDGKNYLNSSSDYNQDNMLYKVIEENHYIGINSQKNYIMRKREYINGLYLKDFDDNQKKVDILSRGTLMFERICE